MNSNLVSSSHSKSKPRGNKRNASFHAGKKQFHKNGDISYPNRNSTDGSNIPIHSIPIEFPSKRRRLDQNGDGNENIVCPYLFTSQGCKNGINCKYKHVNSRREANRLKLKFLLGEDFDDNAIENALNLMDSEKRDSSENTGPISNEVNDAIGSGSHANSVEDYGMYFAERSDIESKNDEENERFAFPSSPTHYSSTTLPESQNAHGTHGVQSTQGVQGTTSENKNWDYEDMDYFIDQDEYEQIDTNDNEYAIDEEYLDFENDENVASLKFLIQSLQKTLCGSKIEAPIFDSEKELLGNVLCEVNRDLNVRSKDLGDKDYPVDVGTAVFDSKGVIIGIISEVIGNISTPFYRVSVPELFHFRGNEFIENGVSFDSIVKFEDLTGDSSNVYVIKKYTNRIKIYDEYKKQNKQNKPIENSFENESEGISLDISKLPKDVQYITKILNHGTKSYAQNQSLRSMWVSDDPTESETQHKLNESDNENQEIDQVELKSENKNEIIKQDSETPNPFQQNRRKRKRDEMESNVDSVSLSSDSSERIPTELHESTEDSSFFKKWCIIS